MAGRTAGMVSQNHGKAAAADMGSKAAAVSLGSPGLAVALVFLEWDGTAAVGLLVSAARSAAAG